MGKPAEELSYQEAMQELIALTNDLGKVTGTGKKKKKQGSDDDDYSDEEEGHYDQEEDEEEEQDQYGMQMMDSDENFDDDELGEIQKIYGGKKEKKDALAALMGGKKGKKSKKDESEEDTEFKGMDGREIIQMKAVSKRQDFDKMVAEAELIMHELKTVEDKLI